MTKNIFNKRMIWILCIALLLCIIPSSFAADLSNESDTNSDLNLDDGAVLQSVNDDELKSDLVSLSNDNSIVSDDSKLSIDGSDYNLKDNLEDGKIKTNLSTEYNDIKSAINSSDVITIYIGAGVYNNKNSGDYVLGDGEANTNLSFSKKNITFIGAGSDKTFIDGSGTDFLFNFTDSNVKFINLSLINAYSNFASVINSSYSNLDLINCNISNNSVISNRSSGSPVYFVSGYFGKYNLTIDNSTFINNRFDYSTSSGGAITIGKAIANITNSKFINNSCNNTGGAIYLCNNNQLTYVKNCSFINNTAGKYGGAIGSYYGGNLTVISSNFTNNSAGEHGGAIYSKDYYSESTKVEVVVGRNSYESCLVNGTEENVYVDTAQLVEYDSDVVIDVSSKTAIFGSDETLDITVKDKSNNTLSDIRLKVEISNSKNNYSKYVYTNETGEVSISLGDLAVGYYNATVSLATDDYSAYPKTVQVTVVADYDYILIIEPANVTMGEGESRVVVGTIYNGYGEVTDELNGSKVYIYWEDYNNSTHALSGNMINGSTIVFDLNYLELIPKGAIYNISFDVEYTGSASYWNVIENGTCYVNVTDGLPEIIPNLDVIYVDIENGDDTTGNGTEENPYKTLQVGLNVNSYLGGSKTIIVKKGVYSLGKYTIKDSVTVIGEDPENTIISQESGRKGVFFINDGLTVRFENFSFTDGYNTVSPYGAIFSNYYNSNLELINSRFYNNTGWFGIINNNGEGNTYILNCSFFNNNASTWGYGAIYTSNGYLTVVNSSFVNNTAQSGGAIFSTGYGNTVIDNCSFVNNSAVKNLQLSGGGAIALAQSSVCKIYNSEFINNIANESGGAIWVYGGDLLVNNSVLINNSGYYGSTVSSEANDGGVNIDVTNSVLFSNDTHVLVFVSEDDTLSNVTVNSNWWGSNDSPNISESISLKSYVVMRLYNDANDLIYATLDTLNTGNPLLGTLPIRNVTYTPEDNFTTPFTQTNENGTSIVQYNGNIKSDYITATIDYQTLVLNYQNVNASNLTITVEDASVRVNSEVTLNAHISSMGFNLTGINITFLVDSEEIGSVLTDNGLATISYTPENAGNYTIRAVFKGNDSYNPSSAEGNLSVLDYVNTSFIYYDNVTNNTFKDNITLLVGDDFIVQLIDSDSNPLANKTVKINVTVLENGVYIDWGGYYNITDEMEELDWIEYTTDADGLIILKDLPSANYIIYGLFEGDKDYSSSYFKANLTVDKTDSVLSIINPSIISNSNLTISLKDNLSNPLSDKTLIISLVDSKGSVTNYTLTTDTNGLAYLNLSAGNYIASIIFEGDETYKNSSISSQITVKDIEIDISLDISPKEIYLGNSSKITIGGIDDESNLVVMINNKVINVSLDENSSFIYTPQAIGDYNISIFYYGVSLSDNLLVKEWKLFSLDLNPDTISIGENTTISIQLNDNITIDFDNLAIYDNSTLINDLLISDSNNSYNLIYTPTESGYHNITVIYLGDDNIPSYTSSKTLKVDDKGSVSVKHTGDDNRDIQEAIDKANPGDIIDLGDNYSYTNVGPVNITKNITIKGGKNITISSNKDADCIFYIVPQSEISNFNLTEAADNVTITGIQFIANDDDVIVLAVGENTTDPLTDISKITITNNTISLSDNSTSPSSVTLLKVETNSKNFNPNNPITITNNTFQSQMKPFTLVNTNWINQTSDIYIPVADPTQSSLTIEQINSKSGEVLITLKDINSIPITNATIQYTLSTDPNTTYTLNTDENGQITLSNLNSNLTIIAVFNGNDLYSPSNATINFTYSSKKSAHLIFDNMTTSVVLSNSRNGEWFNATLVDDQNNPIANKSIQIGFNGKIYNKTTNENGSVSLQINIGYQSANTFSLSFLGDDEYEGTVGVAMIVVNTLKTKLTTSKSTYKSSAKTKTLKATLKLSNGTAISNKKVTFKVNDQYYIATTNSKGVASVTVSLTTKKTYTYTATFNGDYQYSSVTSSNKVVIK